LARIVTEARAKRMFPSAQSMVVSVYALIGFRADIIPSSTKLVASTDQQRALHRDGIGQAQGAKTVDIEWVQVYPTGPVKPNDSKAKIKFLAAVDTEE